MKTAKIILSLFFVTLAIVFSVKPAFAASLSLSPATANKNVGDTFNVDIVLDTEGQPVYGATAIIDYDTDLLSVVDGDTAASGVNIAPGQYLSQVLTNSVNATNGQIRYDAGNLGSPYTGRGVIATISFKATSIGEAEASFVFNQNATTNTSAVAAAKTPTNNLLTTINDGSYSISAGGTTTDEPLLETGALENTIAVILAGILFMGAGIFFARKASL